MYDLYHAPKRFKTGLQGPKLRDRKINEARRGLLIRVIIKVIIDDDGWLPRSSNVRIMLLNLSELNEGRRDVILPPHPVWPKNQCPDEEKNTTGKLESESFEHVRGPYYKQQTVVYYLRNFFFTPLVLS